LRYLSAGCEFLKLGAKGLILAAAIFEVLNELSELLVRPESRAVLQRNKLLQACFIAPNR
jgi:hypothetical protein